MYFVNSAQKITLEDTRMYWSPYESEPFANFLEPSDPIGDAAGPFKQVRSESQVRHESTHLASF